MLIYIDARCLQDGNYAFRGVGYHSSTLLRSATAYLPSQAKLVALIDPTQPAIPSEYTDLFAEILPWSSATFADQRSVFVQLSPMTHSPQTCSRLLDRSGILTAVLIYDFIPLDIPERHLAGPAALRSYAEAMLWLDAYELFYPISEYSERRLLETTKVDPADSFVTGVTLRTAFQEALQSRFKPQTGSGKGSQNLENAYSRPTASPYFMFVGGGDPRKNVDIVIAAHAAFQGETDLVIVGNYSEESKYEFAKTYRKLGGERKRLHFHHGISDAVLAHWYSLAVANVCSSFIEGFSLPVIEGMAAGAPTLVSDIDAHRELVPNSEHRFDPSSTQQLTELMQKTIADESFCNQVRHEQETTPQRFLIDKIGNRFWIPLLKRYEQRFGSTRGETLHVHGFERRTSLAILSPFPPDRSGVGDYTRRTILSLAKYVDVDVFTTCENPQPTPEVRSFHCVSESAYLLGGYDRVLSVVGNSHFHTKIIDLQRKYGGPCLVHDNRLAELYNWWKCAEYFRDMASRSLGREVSLEESQGWIGNPDSLPGIFFDELLDSANPLIVHSRGIQCQIKRQYNYHAEFLPFSCYRDFTEADLTQAARVEAKKRLGLDGKGIHLITLGIVSIATKALRQCIEALAKLNQTGHRADLHFVGSSSPGERDLLFEIASSLNVASRIHFTADWVSESEYRDYVLAADFAIQLRAHFFGGLSGAMLDCIASGLPTVANVDLAEAMDAPEYVLQISDALDGSELAGQLIHAIEKYGPSFRATEARHEYLAVHNFDQYAIEMLRLFGLETPQTAADRMRVA